MVLSFKNIDRIAKEQEKIEFKRVCSLESAISKALVIGSDITEIVKDKAYVIKFNKTVKVIYKEEGKDVYVGNRGTVNSLRRHKGEINFGNTVVKLSQICFMHTT